MIDTKYFLNLKNSTFCEYTYFKMFDKVTLFTKSAYLKSHPKNLQTSAIYYVYKELRGLLFMRKLGFYL